MYELYTGLDKCFHLTIGKLSPLKCQIFCQLLPKWQAHVALGLKAHIFLRKMILNKINAGAVEISS